MLFAGLATKPESDRAGANVGMAILQGGQSIRLVVACIFVIPDANERRFEQTDDCGEHFLARQAAAAQIACDAPADFWQGTAESDHSIVLGLVAEISPIRMIAVLLTAADIAPGGLEVAIGIGTNPDIFPGRRNRQPLYSRKHVGVANSISAGIKISKVSPLTPTSDAGSRVTHIAQTGLARRGGEPA